jgi:hypothetical protein
MTAPEPLDEKPAVPVEIRGGDRDEDFITGIYGVKPDGTELGNPLAESDDFICGCGDQDCEEKK